LDVRVWTSRKKSMPHSSQTLVVMAFKMKVSSVYAVWAVHMAQLPERKRRSHMKHSRYAVRFISLVAFIVLMSTTSWVNAQERQTFPKEEIERAKKEEQETAKTAQAP